MNADPGAVHVYVPFIEEERARLADLDGQRDRARSLRAHAARLARSSV